MNALRVTPLILSGLVLGAHFFRSGHVLGALVVVLAPLILLTRRVWAIRAIQIALVLATAEWIRTAITIGAARRAMGAPSTRMFVILAAVALFTMLSAIPLGRLIAREP
jgi:hypothetical protein